MIQSYSRELIYSDRFIPIESYNDFVQVQIPKTIAMFNPIHVRSEQDLVPEVNNTVEMFITFENFGIHRSQIHENNGATKLMFPQEARLRNFTYSSNMTLDMNINTLCVLEDVRIKQMFYKNTGRPYWQVAVCFGLLSVFSSNISMFRVAMLVNAIWSGGYFIINGSEKYTRTRACSRECVQCFNVAKNNTKWSWMAEIKSVPDFKCISPKQINMYVSSKNNGFGNRAIQIPRIKTPISLFIVFRAIGIVSDEDICRHIVLDTKDANHVTTTMMLALRGAIEKRRIT